jgi:hypothetical protein
MDSLTTGFSDCVNQKRVQNSSIYDPKTNRLLLCEWEKGVDIINLKNIKLEFFPSGNCESCLWGSHRLPILIRTVIHGSAQKAVYPFIIRSRAVSVHCHDDRIASSLIDNYVTAFLRMTKIISG